MTVKVTFNFKVISHCVRVTDHNKTATIDNPISRVTSAWTDFDSFDPWPCTWPCYR